MSVILAERAAPSNGLLPVDREELLSAAIRYWTQFGWLCFPVTADKKPIARLRQRFNGLGVKDWSVAHEELPMLFDEHDATGVAVKCGPDSDHLCVRDYDGAAGRASYEKWAREFPELADTLPTSRTGRGYHVLFRSPASTGGVEYRKCGDGEWRPGGYFLAPPSWHLEANRAYEWINFPGDEIPTIDDPISAGLVPSLILENSQPSRRRPRQSAHKTNRGCGGWLAGYAHLQQPAVVADTGTHGEGVGTTVDSECVATPPVDAGGLPPAVEPIIGTTGPRAVGERNGCVFQLALRLKAVYPAHEPEQLRDIVEEWHRRWLPNIGTKDFEHRDGTWKDFRVAWRRIKPAVRWASILDLANRLPTPKIAIEKRYRSRRQHLAHLVVAAGACWDGRPFFMSERWAAKAVGLSHSGARKALLQLAADGILQRHRRGVRGVDGKATWWKCLVVPPDVSSTMFEPGMAA